MALCPAGVDRALWFATLSPRKGGGGVRNEPVMVVFVSRVVGDGI